MAARQRVAVLDVGRTHTRLALVDAGTAEVLALATCASFVGEGPPYRHLAMEQTEAWLLEQLAALVARGWAPDAIVPVAHGATAALLTGEQFALPVLDYTLPIPSLEPGTGSFAETLSPRLPGGLNLASQLAWLQQEHPAAFARADALLLHPQFWAWRLSGVRAAEVTSLGCHTHLWNPREGRPSRLAQDRGWAGLLPPLARADEAIGGLRPEVAARTGLPATTAVLAGLHDSNAAWWSHRRRHEGRLSVVSTGTWTVVMARGAELDRLSEERDQLASVELTGEPVATMRTPGGLEHAALLDGARPRATSIEGDLLPALASGALPLPAFDASGGPFRASAGRIEGEAGGERHGLAALYGAWMIDLCLEELGASKGEVVVEGPAAQDDALLAALATLRASQRVTRSTDPSGSLLGAASLAAPDLPTTAAEAVHALQGGAAELLLLRTRAWRERLPRAGG